MAAVGFLFVALLILSVGFTIWRLVTLPRRVKRSVQSVRTAIGVVQQRQADKAAGKPVAPISVLAIAGIVVAFVGMIVARTANGIIGLGMIVIGLGLMLLGFNIAQAQHKRADQSGQAPWQSSGLPRFGPSAAAGQTAPTNQNPTQPAPPLLTGAAPVLGAAPAAASSAGAHVAGPRSFNMPPNWPASPPGWTPGPEWQPDPSWPPAPPGWQFWTSGTP